MTGERLRRLEERLDQLAERVQELEHDTKVDTTSSPASAPTTLSDWYAEPLPRPVPTSASPELPTVPRPAPAQVQLPSMKSLVPQLEELLGGRLFAWAGGAAVVIGVAFFMALAISNGWINEVARIILGFIGSGALVGAGLWLHESRGRTQAARAMVAAGIAALYLVLTAATQLYDLIPTIPALLSALAIGGAGTVIAVRLDSQIIGGLGMIGAILAPGLIGAETSALTVAFVSIALAGTVGILVWRGWTWLAAAAFLASTPQVLHWVFDSSSPVAIIGVLALLWALNSAGALGYEFRTAGAKLRPGSAVLFTAASAAVAAAGYFRLVEIDFNQAAELWLAGFAVVQLALGIAVVRSKRLNRQVGILMIGKGVALADISFGLLGGGPVLSAGWAVSAVFFALVARDSGQDLELYRVGVIVQLALAGGQILIDEAPLEALADGLESISSAIISLVTLAAACVACARIIDRDNRAWNVLLDSLGIAVLSYLAFLTLSGTVLVISLAAGAVAIALLRSQLDWQLARVAVAGLLGLALCHVLAVEAPPDSLVYGLDGVAAALAAMLAIAAAGFLCARLIGDDQPGWQPAFAALGGVTLLYLASVLIVKPFQPNGSAADIGVGSLGVRQQGQLLLSVFWSVVGLAQLVIGLRRDLRWLRLSGFGLLTLAVGKVFLFDLTMLESIYRVLSFVVIGLLLLAAAFAYQRLQREDRTTARKG